MERRTKTVSRNERLKKKGHDSNKNKFGSEREEKPLMFISKPDII